ncbi:MAG: hypothetical protein ABIH25_04995 [Candidatus Woesearchaeota archaeon]
MRRALKIGALSLALLLGNVVNCNSPNKIDESKRKTLVQAIKNKRYDSGFLDSKQLDELLENNTRVYNLTEPFGITSDFEEIIEEYKRKWHAEIEPYDPETTGEFSYISAPRLLDCIPENIKRKAVEDGSFIYGKITFVLGKFIDDTLRTTPYNLSSVTQFNAYDRDLKILSPNRAEKYRESILDAMKNVLEGYRVVGEDYKKAVLVQVPFSFGAKKINDKKEN